MGSLRPRVLSIEMEDALFVDASAAFVLDIPLSLFDNVGDLNNDGFDDLGLFTPFQSAFSVVYGDTINLVVPPNGPDGPSPVEVATSRLVTPLLPNTVTSAFDLVETTSPDLADAPRVQGNGDNGQLSLARVIGDINNDGFADVAIASGANDYVVFGPYEFDGTESIDGIANLIVRDGRIVDGSGDLTGNGIDDVVIHRNGADAVEVHEYRINMPRVLESTDAEFTHTANYMTTPGVSSFSILDWDGDSRSELFVSFSTVQSGFFVGYVVGGSELDDVRLLFPIPLNTESFPGQINTSAEFTARVVGDVNGDGRDDIAFASTELFNGPNDTSIGGVQLFPGESTLTEDSVFFVGNALGANLSPLGDINNDGFDDFAVSRSLEASGDLDGGLLVFAGQEDFRTDPSTIPVLTEQDALLRVFRDGAGSLPVGRAIAGPLTAAAGDIDGDGKADLVVGSPNHSIVLTEPDIAIQNFDRGQTGVFFDVLGHGDRINLNDADRTLIGIGNEDRAGVIAAGPLMDVTGDRIADFFVGATGAGLDNEGEVYFVRGGRQTTGLPDEADVQLLENFSGSLVDRQTGQAEVFEDNTLSADEDWYRFTFAGDGSVGDSIQIVPSADSGNFTKAPTVSGSIPDSGVPEVFGPLVIGGDENSVGIVEFDLRNLAHEWTEETAPRVTLELEVESFNAIELQSVESYVATTDQLFFLGRDEDSELGVYASNGTGTGTSKLDLGVEAVPGDLTRLGERLYFTVLRGAEPEVKEFWQSDGTETGTFKVMDLPLTAETFTSSADRIFFFSDGGLEGLGKRWDGGTNV